MPKFFLLQGWRQSRWFAFALFLWRRFDDVRVPQVAASLTFTSLLALVPVLTVALVIVSAFPVFSDVSEAFTRFINSTIVPAGAGVVLDYINEFKEKASRLTTIGIIMLGVTSLLLIQTIDQTFNRIWQVANRRSLWMQFLVYWALLTFGPLVAGISLSIWGLALNRSHIAETFPLLGGTLEIFTSLVFSTVALWLLYRLVPNRYVPSKHAFFGAAVTGVLLEILRWGFKLYVSHFNSYQLIYGTFAAIPIFLVWIHAQWTVVLTGAVLTSSFSYWRGEAFRRTFDSHGRFDDVLKILLLLNRAQKNGKALNIRQFRRHINLGYDELGDLLDQLARYGYVICGKQSWVLKTSPDRILVSDLFRRFVYRRPEHLTQTDPIAQAIDRLMQPCADSMNISLADFETVLERHGEAEEK